MELQCKTDCNGVLGPRFLYVCPWPQEEYISRCLSIENTKSVVIAMFSQPVGVCVLGP
jgi:hypothetical protein